MNKISLEQAEYWSSFQKICVELRTKGLKVHMVRLRQGIKELTLETEKLRNELVMRLNGVETFFLGDCDPDSPKQLAKRLVELGYKLPKSPAGGDSTNKKWLMSKKGDPLIDLIILYRTTRLILRDFFEKPLRFMEYTCPNALVNGAEYGRVFPEMNVFGAAATGRFSSSCPNIQQIPKRSERWGPLCRSLFIPDHPEKTWYSLDWMNQEGRIQVHYAVLDGCTGAESMAAKYQANPLLDQHQEVATLANISRSQAKPINLGISYGMQSGSLAKSLGLKTKWVTSNAGYTFEVAGPEAEAILKKYHTAVPFIQELIDNAKNRIINNGFIRTIGGRHLQRAKDGRDYTGISKLIQGSAADIMYKALYIAYHHNLDIKCIVHDEFCIEGQETDMILMKNIMENTYQLKVPMAVEVKAGPSWGELIKLEV